MNLEGFQAVFGKKSCYKVKLFWHEVVTKLIKVTFSLYDLIILVDHIVHRNCL